MPARRWRAAAMSAVAVMLVAACASGPEGAMSSPEPPAPERVEPFVRTCATSVYGRLARNWEDQALTVGRVSFVYLRENGPRASAWADPRGEVRQLKVLVVVRSGPPQTVSISPATEAALLYDPSGFNRARVLSDGDEAVRFVPCALDEGFAQAPEGETQFNGGLIVDGPVCATLRATEGGSLVAEERVALAGGSCDGDRPIE